MLTIFVGCGLNFSMARKNLHSGHKAHKNSILVKMAEFIVPDLPYCQQQFHLSHSLNYTLTHKDVYRELVLFSASS